MATITKAMAASILGRPTARVKEENNGGSRDETRTRQKNKKV